MKDPESRIIFAGVDGRTDTELPEWYAEQHGGPEPISFSAAIRTLPKAVDTAVAYRNPYTDEWVETERFNALVEPSRARSEAQDEDAEMDPLFHIPTDSYAIINPVDVYGPLEEVLREQTIDGTPLGEVMFGEIRRYRGGGEVHMDIMFDGLEVRLPGRSDPITMGVTSGYDFFGEHAVYVEGFAQDGYCSNTMRSLTDKEIIKHVGDVRWLLFLIVGTALSGIAESLPKNRRQAAGVLRVAGILVLVILVGAPFIGLKFILGG